MKKLFFLLMMIPLFFVQCKKDDMNDDEQETIKVVFEVPLNHDSKTYFESLLPDGNICWGNDNGYEYIYLAVPNWSMYVSSSVQKVIGNMFEMKAKVDSVADKLIFTCDMLKACDLPNKNCYLYYFGNNGNSAKNSNVTSIYDIHAKDNLIGKKVKFSSQTGEIEKLGNYHICKMSVKFRRLKDNTTGEQYFLANGNTFENITSIAKLDLTGETVLQGTAAEIQSFTLLWNCETWVFDEIIEVVPNAKINVSNNNGEDSYIMMLPTDDAVYYECSKGRVEFPDGIISNQLYVGSAANNIDDAKPLKWE